jgi:hypothetical protein
MSIIRPNARILQEHFVELLPEDNFKFVVYNNYKDAFFSDSRKWTDNFNEQCVWTYTFKTFDIHILIISELFTHHYTIKELDALSILEYTYTHNKIDFLNPLFDGVKDHTKIMDMATNK